MGSNDNIRQKLRDLISGKLSCVDNVKHFLSNIEKNNKKFNIFLEVNKKSVDLAKKLDEKRSSGKSLGKLFGLVFAIKSNISVKDMTISCASRVLEDYKGSFDADVIKMIKQEDGIIVGIVNNDEFACGSSGENSAFGYTINPSCPNRVPGGSSSGSGAAVAADMCDIALGSDTGGSIRAPASHCGVIGIKPSYGRVSRYGLIDLAMSTDQIGPLSKDVYGCALVMEVIAGYSDKDSISMDKKVDEYTNFSDAKKYKIGIIKEFKSLISDKKILSLFDETIAKLKNLGHQIIELNIKYIDLSVQAYYPIVYTEFFSGTRKFDGIKYGKKIEDNCGEEVLRRILGVNIKSHFSKALSNSCEIISFTFNAFL
jgi:aspartyl-tRNA(Asn)/glutamyl-tRNA(Gln) amidotransferase subunit A